MDDPGENPALAAAAARFAKLVQVAAERSDQGEDQLTIGLELALAQADLIEVYCQDLEVPPEANPDLREAAAFRAGFEAAVELTEALQKGHAHAGALRMVRSKTWKGDA